MNHFYSLLVSFAIVDFADLLRVAESYSLVTYSIVLGIGITQGLILGRAIIRRFPKLQNHTKIVSISLFIVFAINAIITTMKFADPEKIEVSQIFSSLSPDALFSLIIHILGINAGLGAIIGFSMMLVIIVLLKLTPLTRYSRIFVLVISVIMIIVSVITRLSDYRPGAFEVFLYMLYQIGITNGIIWSTSRKIKSAQESEVS